MPKIPKIEKNIPMPNEGECVICGDYLMDDFIQTAEPIKEGRCCIWCLWKEVAPARYESYRNAWGNV